VTGVVELTSAPAGVWDALAVRSPRGEALQSHAWGEVKRQTGWSPRRYRIDDVDGPVAAVSIQERPLAGGLVGRTGIRFLYAPMGPVLLREDAMAVETALRGLRTIARARRAALLVIDPNREAGGELGAALAAGRFRRARRPVQVSTTGMFVPLELDDAAQRRHLNENARRNVDRARKAGVEVTMLGADAPVDDLQRGLDSAYWMLVETGRRQGFGERLRPAEYHNPAQQRLIETGCASLWLARHEGRDVAHTIVHHCGRRAVLFQAGEAVSDQKRVPANFLLQWSILRWAAETGFTTYDMGGVDSHEAPGIPRDESHPLWNLYRFKAQWGAAPVSFVGAWEHAPWRVLGAGLRTAWRARDRLRS
jgi:lipid II:glycine glycyltransferase (peptidoglycan interpeptide bridge formation enzyme)